MISRKRAIHGLIAASLLVGMINAATAGTVVIDNLGDFTGVNPNSSHDVYLGQSFTTGSQTATLNQVEFQANPTFQPSAPTLTLDSKNVDGTVGSVLSSAFSASVNSGTGLVTFTATSTISLAASTSYWLVLTNTGGGQIYFAIANNTTYSATNGYTIPTGFTSMNSTITPFTLGNSHYYSTTATPGTLIQNPDVFQLQVTPSGADVPELDGAAAVSAFTLLGMGVMLLDRRWRSAPRER